MNDKSGVDGPCRKCPKDKFKRCEDGKITTIITQDGETKVETACPEFIAWYDPRGGRFGNETINIQKET